MRGNWLAPDWPELPAGVRAATTLRMDGASAGEFSSFNLGAHVGDAPAAVAENRRILRDELRIGAEPRWLDQVHGTRVAILDGSPVTEPADAAISWSHGEICAVLTADCLPVLFCNRIGRRIAAAHAGWRGLAAGVLEATVEAMGGEPEGVMAWLGPAIGPGAYEVGEDVRRNFMSHAPEAAQAFTPGDMPGKWWCDLYLLARQRLAAAGVKSVAGGDFCTYTDEQRFFSFRRDGRCGRMATLIWLAD
jgi:hypothetical protein